MFKVEYGVEHFFSFCIRLIPHTFQQCIKASDIQLTYYLYSVFLDYPIYEAPITRLYDYLWIPEHDQVIGCVIIGVLYGVVKSPGFQA